MTLQLVSTLILVSTFLLLFLSTPIKGWPSASDFNGTTSKLAVTHHTNMVSSTITWCAWVSRDGNGENAIGRIFDKHSGTASDPGIRLQISSNLLVFFYDWTTTTGEWDYNQPSVTDWHHICVAYNDGATTNDPTVWYDGTTQAAGSEVTPAGSPDPGTKTFNIGNDPTNVATWDGRIASAAFYNRVLTTNEVKQIMRRGPLSLRNGLVCYWPLGAFAGSGSGGSTGTSCSGTFTDNTVNTSGPPVSCPQGGVCE